MTIERPHVQRLVTSPREAHSSVHARALCHTLSALVDIEGNSECVPSAEAATHALNEAERELTPVVQTHASSEGAHEQPRVRIVSGGRCPRCASDDTHGTRESGDFHCHSCGFYEGAESA